MDIHDVVALPKGGKAKTAARIAPHAGTFPDVRNSADRGGSAISIARF
jgi:hypothetical protein